MKNNFIFVLRLIAAAIFLQTLYFKFTGAPESVYIFSTLGIEPWGRWFAGLSELLASLLLLFSGTAFLGAVMGMGIMLGAILSHLTILGIVVQDDGGLLFSLACVVLMACSLIVFLLRGEIPLWIKRGQNLLLSVKK